MTATTRTVGEYVAAQPENLRSICEALTAVLDENLERAQATVWHGHPVWMIGSTPVAGFKAASKWVTVMLWRGQDIDAPGLTPTGSSRMGSLKVSALGELDPEALGAWLRAAESLDA
ncbi:DUF1801 domain-containing protein [Herbiconiux liangxiaofengii]|uniref:DUF1801 domain-containing protein n=1 Tax=Herbiconiux liangxiaofengii TaxID=3342795 RepID=UPI0035B84A76